MATASGTARMSGKPEHLQHAAEADGDEPAERADGDVHLADAERHHLGEADEQADAEAPQHDVDVELGEEVRREDGEHDRADEDRHQRGPTIRPEQPAEECVHRRPSMRRSA